MAKLRSANEVRADYFVSNCCLECSYQLKSYVVFAAVSYSTNMLQCNTAVTNLFFLLIPEQMNI